MFGLEPTHGEKYSKAPVQQQQILDYAEKAPRHSV